MPIIKSAKKALRSSSKKRVYNIRRQKKVEVAIKDIKKLVADKKSKEASKALSLAYAALDKAAKAGTIKKGAADRKKSRLAAFIRKNA
jgi:small subunit ribosomal protein S20